MVVPGQDVVQAQTPTEGHVWGHGPAAAEVCADARKKSEDHTELALPFIDPGKAYTTVKELAPALRRDGLYPSQSEGEPTLRVWT